MSSGKDEKIIKKTTTRKKAIPKGEGKLRPRTVARVSQDAALFERVIHLRAAGATFKEIAAQAGLESTSQALELLRRALSETIESVKKDADIYVAEELQRIELLTRSLWTLATGRPERKDANGRTLPAIPPDLKAVDRILRIMERKARLLGLDAPVRHELGAGASQGIAPSDALDAVINALQSGNAESSDAGKPAGGESEPPTTH